MVERARTQDDNVMAALAHGAVILPLWGIIAAVIIWVTQKEKSRFVAFQSLQALVYQFLPILGFIICFLCYFCSFAGFFLVIPLTAFAAEGGEMGEPLAVILSFLPMGLPFVIIALGVLVWLAYIAYAVYAAVRVLQGHDFHYLFIGPWLERYVNRQPAEG